MTTRTARRTERGLPLPALALAVIAIVFFALPLAGRLLHKRAIPA